ncbi:MAG: hypothetical protein ABIQ11_00270 [Saprospiraceae bacterium]
MKIQTLVSSLIVFILLSLSLGCSRKVLPTAKVNYLSSNDGTVTMRAIGISSNQEDAISDAEKNAFNVIFFRGLPESEQKIALIGTNEPEELEKHKEYFNKFYKDKRYKTFVMSSVPRSDLIKYKGGENSISIDIKVNLVALRKDLEQNNIIRKFGF